MAIQKHFWVYHFWKIFRQKKMAGISLTELLVTIVIGGIAITGLLAAMVELLQTDQYQAVREETQQEMQTALSFITEDLRESVYIYDGTQTRSDGSPHYVYDYLPNFATAGTPILAFWKAETLSSSQLSILDNMDCTTLATTPVNKQAECNNLKLKRRAYSLIVYLQSTESDPKWPGKSRILRYELPQYNNSDFANLTWSTGFVDPSAFNNFPIWPYDQNNNKLQNTLPLLEESPPEVLVDFLDAPNNSDSEVVSQVPDCPADDPNTQENPDYLRLPAEETSNNSFFACVRNIGNYLGKNQDIILYLRGNAYGKGGNTDESYLSTLQTSITLRGVIDKFN
jgi:Tfp pilus assembly protein PilV